VLSVRVVSAPDFAAESESSRAIGPLFVSMIGSVWIVTPPPLITCVSAMLGIFLGP
jgi:hypothetical protein